MLASHAIVMSYNRLDLESDNIIMISTAVMLSVERFRGCQTDDLKLAHVLLFCIIGDEKVLSRCMR